jgi:predicted amidohydrolase
MTAVALANYAAPQQGGRSAAFDAVSYDFEGSGEPLDPVLLLAAPQEAVLVADFDLDRLRAFRRAETQGDAYRKPAAYTSLLRSDAHAPFVRGDSRRAPR